MQKNKKIILALLISLTLLVSHSLVFVLAQTPSTTTYLSPGSMVETASYIIWQDGSNYFCKDGETGQVTSDTDLGDITQDCLTDLTSSGGTLFLSEVSWDSDLSVPENVMVYEQLEGSVKRYINSADSQESPYTISTDGTNYYAQDSAFSYINSWTSTSANTVIQSALNNLTSGRTWEEMVKCKGLFSLSTTITVPSNTTLDLREAYLSGTMTSPNYVITTASGATNIDIIGGIVDGTTVSGHAIYFNSAIGCRLLWTEVKNAGDHNIVLAGCTNCEVNAYSHDAGSDGIALTDNSTRCTVDGRYDENGLYGMLITSSTNNAISGRYHNNTNYGIRLNCGADNNTFVHPIIDTLTWGSGRGIFLDASDTGLGAGGNSGNVFISPIVKNCPDRGIWLYSTDGYPNSDNIFVSPIVESNGAGIDISTFSTYNQIRGGIVKNNDGYGVFITGTGQKVIGVHAYDDRTPKQQTYGIYVNSDDNHRIIENNVADNLSGNIYVVGTTTTEVRDNIGYITENLVSGENTTATTFVIAHGLAGAATHVICSFNSTAIEGYSWTSDATNITVTVTGTLPAAMTCYADVRYEP